MSLASLLQTGLFAAEPRVLAEDAEGGIRYWPDSSTRRAPHAGSSNPRRPWSGASSRPMYDRVVDVPRLRRRLPAGRQQGVAAGAAQAALAVSEGLGVAFTHVGMNHYRDGRDSVAPHNDKLQSIVPGFPIALLSLGATRRMDIREKEPGGRRRSAADGGSTSKPAACW